MTPGTDPRRPGAVCEAEPSRPVDRDFFRGPTLELLNVVSGEEGNPEAILVRALQPTRGIEIMRERRGRRDDRELTNGPGKLCQALGITLEHYGWDLTQPPFYIRPAITPREEDIACGPRIGIDSAGEARYYPWRFWLKGNPFVSR